MSYRADDTEDKVDPLTQAMSNLTSATTDLEDKVIMDHNWKNKGRVSCRNITSSDILNSRVEDLEEFCYDIQQRMVDTVSEVLVAFGREEETAVTETENSVYYRIAYDTLQNYISWHKFLQGVVVEHGFAEALLYIRDLSSKLISYRTTYVSKVQCLARTYTYLRDLQDNNWVTQKMHAKQVNRLLSGITKGGGKSNDRSSGVQPCGHCGVAVHFGGASKCPWKDKPKSEAHQLAVAQAQMGA